MGPEHEDRQADGPARAEDDQAKPGRYGDGGNLHLNIRPNGSRAWVLRYALPGRKPRDMGLSSEGEVSLAQVRGLAREARILLREGRDPITVRDEAAQATIGQETTFRALAATYVAAHKASWKNEVHKAQWTSTLEAYANPILGDLSVSMIQVADVMKVLEPIWTGKPETSSRLRGKIKSILDYAAAQGWRTGENPARWKGHLSKLLPAPGKVAPVRHHAAMPWKECPAFMRNLATRGGAAAQALRFTILTATRTSEVTGATWREMRLDGEE